MAILKFLSENSFTNLKVASSSTKPRDHVHSLKQVLTGLIVFSARHQQPPSPFKRPLGLAHLASAHVAGNGNSLSENSSCASTSSSTSTSGMAGSHSLQVSSEPSGSEHGFHSGHLPTIADVRSPDVLHPKHGPCDCLTHPLHVSSIEKSRLYTIRLLTGKLTFLNSCKYVKAG